jgi:hypothetical protein
VAKSRIIISGWCLDQPFLKVEYIMIFLNPIDDLINPSNNDNLQKCNKHNKEGKHLFLFLYMNGCPPCNQTKENWKHIQSQLNPEYLNDDDIMLSQINYKLYDKLDNVGDEPMAFPTLRHIHNNKVEEYNDGKSTDELINWIKSKIKLRKNHPKTHRDEDVKHHKRIEHHSSKRQRHHTLKGGKGNRNGKGKGKGTRRKRKRRVLRLTAIKTKN